LFTHVPL